MFVTWCHRPRQPHGRGCSSCPLAAGYKWGRGAAIRPISVVSHQSLPPPAALLLFHRLGLYKSWGKGKNHNTSRSINYEYFRDSNPFFTHIFETVVYAETHLNVREPEEKFAHTCSISALEPMDRIWMRPSSTNLMPAWEEPWWDSAAGGLPSSGRQWLKTLKTSSNLWTSDIKVSWWRFCVSPLSLSPSFSSCSVTNSHIEALKPLAMWGQQFCPTRGKWRGAACQGDERRWLGRHSVSPSLRPGDSLPFQSKPTLFPPAAPFCLELADTPPGVEAPRIIGKVRKWRGSIFMLASTICRMPFSKTSWQVTKETGSEKDGLYHFRFDKEKNWQTSFLKP